jgi:hypothetical protein
LTIYNNRKNGYIFGLSQLFCAIVPSGRQPVGADKASLELAGQLDVELTLPLQFSHAQQ